MNAGKTRIPIGTKVRTTKRWDKDDIVTGTITHPFGYFGGNPIAGIRIDKKYQSTFGDIGNLYKGDFEILSESKKIKVAKFPTQGTWNKRKTKKVRAKASKCR
jgi:hypothetical protein